MERSFALPRQIGRSGPVSVSSKSLWAPPRPAGHPYRSTSWYCGGGLTPRIRNFQCAVHKRCPETLGKWNAGEYLRTFAKTQSCQLMPPHRRDGLDDTFEHCRTQQQQLLLRLLLLR
eukprot:1557139-Pleurochrysis_carterae.AAC.2